MGKATIQYDAVMAHWPTESTLVKLEPPLVRYDVKTGKKVLYNHVAVHIRARAAYPDNHGVDIFAATETGDPVHPTMMPLDSFDYAVLHSILKQMGYDVAN